MLIPLLQNMHNGAIAVAMVVCMNQAMASEFAARGSRRYDDTAVTVTVASPLLSGMLSIPAGHFRMGDHFNEGWGRERPVHTVHISAFHMDRYPVTKALWDKVLLWATHPDRGTEIYIFDCDGCGHGYNHPVYSINWYDAVKWCNARSEMEGLSPAYYTAADRTRSNIYRTGHVDIQNDWVCWESGYRLPTEAEWEYAARGGLSGKRFPWGDRIDHNRANYYASGEQYEYDDGPENGVFHPKGLETGCRPHTTPVDYFEPNNFDLYDMGGNVWEWTWDWYNAHVYARDTATNPRGSSLGSFRVVRGGSWYSSAIRCRVVLRRYCMPGFAYHRFGFRSVRSSNPIPHRAGGGTTGEAEHDFPTAPGP